MKLKLLISILLITGFVLAVTNHHTITPEITTSRGICIKEANRLITIKGESMEPFAFENNTLLARKYKGEELIVGDIIRFKDSRPTGYTIHQIIWTDGINHATKGFNNDQEDNRYVQKEDIEDIILGVLLT